MNTFTIRDIENLSGIKAHTLRVWEQRYGIICPMRKDSNHRLYGIEDLKKILRISFLYNQGYKISRIAELGEDQIKKLSIEFKPKGSYEVFINQMMEASMDFDEEMFRSVMDNAMIHLGMEKLMTLVIYPFLNKVGVLWMTGNVIPSQEHFATNIIRNKILMAANQLPPKPKNEDKKYILFNPPGEYHEIPLLFVQYCLKQRGISTVLFGIDTSTDLVKEYLRKNRSTHLFLFMTTNFTHMNPMELLEDIKRNFPGLKIEVAGNSFRGLQTELGSGISIFSKVEDFIRHLDT